MSSHPVANLCLLLGEVVCWSNRGFAELEGAISVFCFKRYSLQKQDKLVWEELFKLFSLPLFLFSGSLATRIRFSPM